MNKALSLFYGATLFVFSDRFFRLNKLHNGATWLKVVGILLSVISILHCEYNTTDYTAKHTIFVL